MILVQLLLIVCLHVFCLGPSEAENLQVTADSNSLEVSWHPGPGETERFWLVLKDGKSTGLNWNSTLANTSTSYVIKNLIPGRLYNITVITEVGEEQNSVSRQTQTGILYWTLRV